MSESIRLALVGPDQQENLALQYLAAAAEHAGHQATLVRFNTPSDLDATVSAVLNQSPALVGLGIAFQYSIGDYVELARVLRERGFGGHITCGGHVPTFCHEELLRDAPAIDSAVRHEGEQTLVEMAGLLAKGELVRGLPGLVWRDGAEVVVGPPRRPMIDLDALPWPKRRQSPMLVGGVPIAFLLTARGCIGDCAYCSIRAFGREMGGDPLRMRNVESVACEVASLQRDKAVRVFFAQDDLFVLPNERASVDRMRNLSEALRRHHAERAVFWIKGRPEAITPAVLQAAREMGAIHIFLGVESASAERLRYLGRVHTPEQNRTAIALCREHGVKPSFNFMLFDPDCSLADVTETLQLAEENLDLPWNVCRTEIYSGTRLLERLQQEGRLQGDYRSYGYRMRCEHAEVAFRILRVCLHHHAFAFDSLLNKLISLSFAAQLHEALFPSDETQAIAAQVEALVIDAHRDTLRNLRAVMDFAQGPHHRDRDRVQQYAVSSAMQINARDLEHLARFDDLWERLHDRGRRAQCAWPCVARSW